MNSNICIEYEKLEYFNVTLCLLLHFYTSDGGSVCPASITLYRSSTQLMATIARVTRRHNGCQAADALPFLRKSDGLKGEITRDTFPHRNSLYTSKRHHRHFSRNHQVCDNSVSRGLATIYQSSQWTTTSLYSSPCTQLPHPNKQPSSAVCSTERAGSTDSLQLDA
jgi:hypothetical protein